MKPLVSFGLWQWIEENRGAFEPPVGNKVIWEDSQFTAMVIRGPNARRDFHVDPSDEIFYMLKGDMVLEYLEDGQRHSQTIREGEMCLVPAFAPHSPHRPADTWGLVIEVTRAPTQTESLVWFCDRCNSRLHEVTMHVADIEKELKAAIEHFDASRELRTCAACGHVQPERPPVPEPMGDSSGRFGRYGDI
ncbi:MAG: 3-hydroxyanthranilate 3,4-dioxygenase [Candidatus Rokubacteria bacterium 13_1_40CM_4_69_5]|nr:MAG: 3-hydroxyanthranilate 3,4-dioxygenase [Candidatus Rokubacteria bacterium 13_1_40CM_4_69_5]